MAKIRQFGGVTDVSVQALETHRVVEPSEVGEADVVEVQDESADDEAAEVEQLADGEAQEFEEEVEDEGTGEPMEPVEVEPVDYSKMLKPDLQAELKRRNADTTGTAPELRERLAAMDAGMAV